MQLIVTAYRFTCSSDLWVATNVPGAKDTGKSATLSYAVGQAAGMSGVIITRSAVLVLMSHSR